MVLQRHRGLAPLALILAAVAWGCESGSMTPSAPTEPTPPSSPPSPPPNAPQSTVTHTLSITASASCAALPAVAAIRTYPAQLQEQANGELRVRVVNSADIMIGWANDAGFAGTRNGNAVRFDLTDDLFAPYAMIERIPGVGDMGYFGTATGTIDSNSEIVATFDGEYRLGYGKGPVLCRAPDHRITVTRIGS